MQLANHEAQRLRHEYIGTEHILLGLVKEGSGMAANVLRNLDVDLRRVRLEVEKLILPGPHDVAAVETSPRTPRAKKAIEYAMEEARNLNHDRVGTEHILLGLLREQEGVAAQILMNLGLRLEDVRAEVLAIVGRSNCSAVAVISVQPIAEPPAVCPKCGQPHIVHILWGWVHLSGQDEEDVRSGKAILALRHRNEGPPWVCLHCAPGWSEAHRLAMQEWEWQLAKEAAIEAEEFEKAAWYRDSQDELRRRLSHLVNELSSGQ
jgi:hypothetical protein